MTSGCDAVANLASGAQEGESVRRIASAVRESALVRDPNPEILRIFEARFPDADGLLTRAATAEKRRFTQRQAVVFVVISKKFACSAIFLICPLAFIIAVWHILFIKWPVSVSPFGSTAPMWAQEKGDDKMFAFASQSTYAASASAKQSQTTSSYAQKHQALNTRHA